MLNLCTLLSAGVAQGTYRNHLQGSYVITLIYWWYLFIFHLVQSISFYSFWILRKLLEIVRWRVFIIFLHRLHHHELFSWKAFIYLFVCCLWVWFIPSFPPSLLPLFVPAFHPFIASFHSSILPCFLPSSLPLHPSLLYSSLFPSFITSFLSTCLPSLPPSFLS
jgi:hypothetical protein